MGIRIPKGHIQWPLSIGGNCVCCAQGKKGAAVTTVKELSEIVANPFAALATDQVEE